MPRAPVAACAALVVAATLAPPSAARGDGGVDYFGKRDTTSVTYRRAKPRTLNQRLTIGGLAAGAVLSLGVGVYFHLDSRDAADEVSADHGVVGTWTDARQATYDRAGSSGTKAIVGYVLAALFTGGTIAATVMTHPGDEEVVLTPGARAARPLVTPVAGGAVVGGAWSW
ncbi:MAG: hypothetical protein H6709_19975 [Kofleriaceae bacterium]|nr:hypothetical protein [Myxococcales bacterium]MCB9561326.1 hypothetical protein [Kofleriaceae bacterium]MCB9574365.1 hypothetical protein [Kofleriaceae bacterium]